MTLTHVLRPIRIGGIEIPNRVVRTAHGTHFARPSITDTFIDYHEARARGGCGLTILEIASVHPSSIGTILNFDDGIIPGYQRLMSAIRPHGMKVFQQLHHGGHNFPGADGIAWSASDVAGPLGIVPVAMRRDQIEEVIAAFAAAARRCRQGGLDGVEIHGAHGYLFHQFMSPLTNHRTDEYGGSLQNRMRLLLQTMRAVRAAVGDLPIGVRLSASLAPGVVTEEDQRAVVAALEAEGLIDFLDVSVSDYYAMNKMNATMETPTGYELPSAAQITAGCKVPRIVAGRFRTLEEADQVIREGTADLVAMVRAQIADPDLVRKTRDGRADQVRPCIACNQGCIGGLFRGGQLGCLVNPAVGFEARLSDDKIARTAAPRRVLVVGGGPAGLEAARVAALAGHRVVLAEASPHLGGAVRVARRAPYLQTLGDITDWLEQEVFRLGVEVRLSTFIDAALVRAEQADAVVIATGSLPRMDGVQSATPWIVPGGVDLPHVMSSHDVVLRAKAGFAGTALVLDDVGHYEAIAVTDALLGQGVAVTFVTRHAQLTPYVESTQRTAPAMERFGRGDFTLLVRSQLTDIRPGQCIVRPIHGGRDTTVPADHVVLVTPNRPLSELNDDIAGTHGHVVRIGDALSPRDVQAAIAEGRRAAMAL